MGAMLQEFLAIAVLALVLLMVVVLLLTILAHLRTATPYGGTPQAVGMAMVHLARLEDGQRVCDIGAGDGRLLIAAKRACSKIQAVGFENALGVWLVGKLRILWSGQKVRLLLRDARKFNFSRADAVFLYVGPEMMRSLLPKFDRELKKGARVVSHSFRFPGRKPVKVEEVSTGKKVKKVYLYRW